MKTQDLKPGKLCRVKSDGCKLRVVVVENTIRHPAGTEWSQSFYRNNIFMYVKSLRVDSGFFQELVPETYEDGETLHQFLLGETSYWFATYSLNEMIAI